MAYFLIGLGLGYLLFPAIKVVREMIAEYRYGKLRP